MVKVVETKTKSVTPTVETQKRAPGQDDQYVVQQEVIVKVEDEVDLSNVAEVVGEATKEPEEPKPASLTDLLIGSPEPTGPVGAASH